MFVKGAGSAKVKASFLDIKFNLNTGEKLKQQRNFNALNVIMYSQQILIWKLTLDQFILVSNVNLDRKLEENP